MQIDFDLTLFYGIPNGIREMTVMPFPVRLSSFAEQSQIGYTRVNRYPFWHPCKITAFPYRCFARSWRTLHRLCVGLGRWFFPPKPNDKTIER
jgi:hypothetical protein